MKKPLKKTIYLDYAAATPLDLKVLQAMEPYFSKQFYNPSAVYLAGRDVRQALEAARATVANCLGTRPPEIVFTAGATEANNLAIQGLMRQFPDGEVLVSAIEHESVLEPAKLFKHRLIPVTKEGLVDLAKLEKMITPKTALVSIGLVNNEISTVQPLREISKILNPSTRLKAGKRILLHTDAAQAGNLFDLHVSRLGVDMMSLNGGKIYGPKQSGALYVKAGVHLKPLILGGGQESGLRSGTENLPGVIGFAEALRIAQLSKKAELARLQKLYDYFVDRLRGELPDALVNGHPKQRSPHIINVSLPGQDGERLMMELDEHGIIAAVGSACSASAQEPSHVLSAIGLPKATIRSSLRFSLGRATSAEDLETTVEVLTELIGKNKS